MFRTSMLIVFLFAVSIPEGFCNGTDCTKEMSRNETLKVGKAENGNIIEVRCGDMIRIELEALGAAGYNWYVDNLNTDFLELMPEITRRAPGEKTGGPVTGVWLFKTKNKGISEIKMDHYRIWEGKEAAIGHFSVKLSIE